MIDCRGRVYVSMSVRGVLEIECFFAAFGGSCIPATHQNIYTVSECVVLHAFIVRLKQDTGVILLGQQSNPAGIRMCSNMLL